jgi:hypothetical protein
VIYLILELWTCNLENDVAAAVGYEPLGYVNTEDEAKRVVANMGVEPKSTCWALRGDTPRGKYKALLEMKLQEGVSQ